MLAMTRIRSILAPRPLLMSRVGRTLLALTLPVSSVLSGCGSSETRPVFGGEGASIEAQQTPLSEAPPEQGSGPCAQAAPASDTVLIEDFEDADHQLFKAFQREGWWYVAVDETQGTIFPTVGEFAATPLPPTEATLENRHALHGKAEGFRDWGVIWGTTTRWVNDGVKCPFNASNFDGMTFRVKGKGSLHLKLGNPATTPPEYEGTCKERCWDAHGMRFPLSDDWQQVVVRWDRVQQGGWGAQAEFDPARLLTMNFSVAGKDLPVEFWLDDLYFLERGKPVPSLVPAEPAVPSATGESSAPPAVSSGADTETPPGPAAAPSALPSGAPPK